MNFSPRILFVAASDWLFYWHRVALARQIAAAGYDIHVATPAGRFRDLIEAAGLRHHAIRIDRNGLNPLKDLATIKQLVGLYRELKPVLVHHIAIKPIIYGLMAAKIAKVPVILNAMPGMGYVFLSKQAKARLLRPAVMTAFRLLLNAPNSRMIVENDDHMRKWARWKVVRRDRLAIIPGSGIDTTIFRPGPEPAGPPLVLLPARLLFEKGIVEFVQAASSLRRSSVAARFALVGERDSGNPASIPQPLLRQWQQEGVVELFGWRDDMTEVLAQSHIVCLPSYDEGLPRSLLEAAACGKPIVTTDVAGCRDVVRHGDNGLLVPAHQAEPLAAALSRLIGDDKLRRSMGQRGRERAVAEFSVEIVAAKTLRLYEELLGPTVTKKSEPIDSMEKGAPVADSRW